MTKARNHLQNTIDSGVLAAAAYPSDSNREKELHGKTVAEKNIFAIRSGDTVTIDLTIDHEGVITGTAMMDYDPFIMHMFKHEKKRISAYAETSLESGSVDAEIVLVLDYSSSMNGQYVAMRDAAINLISTLSANEDAEIDFGLVPFAEEVFLEVDGRYIIGGNTGVLWKGCTISRKWPFVISDRTPNSSDNSKWGEGGTECRNYPSRDLVVRPLDGDAKSVITQLKAMVPHRGTNTSLGVEIEYQLLSPNLPFKATEFTRGKKKFLVVLSDGELTRGSYGPGNNYSTTQAYSNLQRICEEAAQKNVTVVTVLYETDSPAAKNAMKNCASTANTYMQATEGDIADRFMLIADLVKSEVRLGQ